MTTITSKDHIILVFVNADFEKLYFDWDTWNPHHIEKNETTKGTFKKTEIGIDILDVDAIKAKKLKPGKVYLQLRAHLTSKGKFEEEEKVEFVCALSKDEETKFHAAMASHEENRPLAEILLGNVVRYRYYH